MNERQLQWVSYNHADPGDRMEPPRQPASGGPQAWPHSQQRRGWYTVGELAQVLLRSPRVRGSALQRRVSALLEEHLGPGFLEQAAVAGVRAGTLTLYVAEPALLYRLRLQYEQCIARLLQTALPGAGINTVRFVVRPPY